MRQQRLAEAPVDVGQGECLEAVDRNRVAVVRFERELEALVTGRPVILQPRHENPAERRHEQAFSGFYRSLRRGSAGRQQTAVEPRAGQVDADDAFAEISPQFEARQATLDGVDVGQRGAERLAERAIGGDGVRGPQGEAHGGRQFVHDRPA